MAATRQRSTEEKEEQEQQEGFGRSGVSRRQLVSMAGGSVALGAFLAACGSDDSDSGSDSMSNGSGTTGTSDSSMSDDSTAQFGEGDIGIMNYALTLEYLETAFYEDVAKSGLFKGSDLETIRKFGSQEAEHVAALTAAVKKAGGKPAAKPKTEFPLNNAKQVLRLASTVENLGAAAYLGQAARIQSPDVLAAALSIHSVEGRHAAALNTLLGKTPVPDGPFAAPAPAAMVLNAVQPFIVS
ncbi:MAG: ferritin-like domain-containing protein [Solirubrobacterales bacterium]|nr:ferritin-like domain-containing protein [Solirubrobacterales bacterium]MCB0862817.1 ferritin-like domain-containing protein [Solirubrobacterales bacterium]HRV59423.1 ferritin-like domain-containing protein [Solirubrobacterales bacterium]